MRELLPSLMAATTVLAILLLLVVPGMNASSSSGRMPLPSTLLSTKPLAHSRQPWVLVSRGGSSDTDSDSAEDYEDEDGIEEDDDEDIIIEDDMEDYDEDEDEEDAVMVKSAVKAAQKQRTKRNAEIKEAVSAKLSVKRKKKRSLIQRYIPYIVRASLNPITLLAMTRAYFASLFNLNYLAEDSSQDLRSALEEKAKKSGGSSGGRKGKRTMKPGQAKTLSDLPQLNT